MGIRGKSMGILRECHQELQNSVVSMDAVTKTYLIGSLAVLFPIVFQLHVKFSLDDVHHAMCDPGVQVFAACCLAASVPVATDLILDAASFCWIKNFVLLRACNLGAMILYAAAYASIDSTPYRSPHTALTYSEIVIVLGHFQAFTLVFVVLSFLSRLDTRGVFLPARSSAALSLAFLHILFNLIANQFPASSSARFPMIMSSAVTLMVLLIWAVWSTGTWLQRLRLSFLQSSFSSFTEWGQTLAFQDMCCMLLCSIVLTLAPVILALLFFMNDSGELPDQTTDVSYLKASFVVRMVVTLMTTTLPGRMIRSCQIEDESTAEFKTEWVQFISHEMRTPLGIIAMGLELAHLKKMDKEEILSELKDLRAPCANTVELLDQLLLLEQLEKKEVIFQTKKMDPFAFLKAAVKPMSVEMLDKGVSCEAVFLKSELFDDISKLKINVDVTLLGNAVRKLIDKTLASTGRGGKIRFEIEIATDKQRVESIQWFSRFSRYLPSSPVCPLLPSDFMLRIKIPLPAKLTLLDKYLLMHDKFKREADEEKRSYGIGIWIGKHVLATHNGRMVEDVASDGSSVCRFDLPICVDKTEDLRAIMDALCRVQCVDDLCMLETGESSPKVVELIDKKAIRRGTVGTEISELEERSLRVLVVDDSAMTRKILTKLMKSLGHECCEADDGSVAVEMMRLAMQTECVYDVILLDNEMPIMKGRDAVRIIREMGFRGRVFGVTGNVLQSDISDFVTNGADLVILKPMTVDKFKVALKDTASQVFLE